MYDLAKKHLEAQKSLPEKDSLIAELENIQKSDNQLPVIQKFILKLYDIAEEQDYLKRKNASTPIQKIAEYPPIYQAIKSLTDTAVQLKLKEFDKIQTEAQFNQFVDFLPKNLNINSRESLIKAIAYHLRISLITGEKNNLNQFIWWKDETHYFFYPSELFKEQKTLCDRLDIDAILSCKHFSTRPLEQAISRQDTQYQLQPGFISLSTDSAAQYDPKTGTVTNLLNSYYKFGKDRIGILVEKDKNEAYPIRLLSTGVTNCHTVIIHDSHNQYLMLHVSPASVTGGSDNFFFESVPKKAYLDLQPKYTNPDLGLQKNSTIDVVIVDNGGYFRRGKLEQMLPKGVSINSLQEIKPDLKAGQPYAVCFLPDENMLCIKGYNYFVQHDGVFKPMSHSDDFVANHLSNKYG